MYSIYLRERFIAEYLLTGLETFKTMLGTLNEVDTLESRVRLLKGRLASVKIFKEENE